MTKRYILTGAPGCGKTAILRGLELEGCRVVEEAATDVIAHEQALGNAEPWKQAGFVEKIVLLQKQRQAQADLAGADRLFFDRSPICSRALATFLGLAPPAILLEEMTRIAEANLFQNKVFFIENLGFCQPTAARKISFADSVLFEKIHRTTYLECGFELQPVPPGPLPDRVVAVLHLARGPGPEVATDR